MTLQAGISVVHVTNSERFDESGNAKDNGLYDPRLGPSLSKTETNRGLGKCKTCNGSENECPGHFGHHELAVPVTLCKSLLTH